MTFADVWRSDPLQLPATGDLPAIHGIDLLDGAVVGSWLWLTLTAAVAAGLAAVLLLAGLRRLR